MPNTVFWIQLAFVPILIAVNAFFVAAEYAIIAIRPTRIEELLGQGVGIARTLKRLKEDISGSLATVQVCITATGIVLGAVGEPALTELSAWVLSPLGFVLPHAVARPLAVVMGLTIVTIFTVVLSELLPKAMTLQYTEAMAIRVARPMAFFRWLISPLAALVMWIGNRISRMLGWGDIRIEEPVHSEEELEMLVDQADAAGEFHEEHGDLVRRAFDFADLTVRQVMIPLQNAGVLDSTMTADELAEKMSQFPYTRWAIRDPKTGKIAGIVNIKFALHALALAAGQAVILQDLALPPTFLDPDLSLVDALGDLRRTRRHMAVVRSREGADIGIVTLEDILEAIVGAIPSEVGPPREMRRRIIGLRGTGTPRR